MDVQVIGDAYMVGLLVGFGLGLITAIGGLFAIERWGKEFGP